MTNLYCLYAHISGAIHWSMANLQETTHPKEKCLSFPWQPSSVSASQLETGACEISLSSFLRDLKEAFKAHRVVSDALFLKLS